MGTDQPEHRAVLGRYKWAKNKFADMQIERKMSEVIMTV